MLVNVLALQGRLSHQLEPYQLAAFQKLNEREEKGEIPRFIHTLGLYNNGDWKDNGVIRPNLENHIVYNFQFRPGRALFIDGICVNRGYIDEGRCADAEDRMAANPVVQTKDTAPYQ